MENCVFVTHPRATVPNMRVFACFTLILTVAGCGNSDTGSPAESPPFDCNLGGLTGTWRLEITRVDGTCGDISSTTVSLDAPSADGCVQKTRKISTDKCHLDFDTVCPAVSPPGTTEVVGVTRQTSPTELEGNETITLSGTGVDCHGTYTVAYTKLLRSLPGGRLDRQGEVNDHVRCDRDTGAGRKVPRALPRGLVQVGVETARHGLRLSPCRPRPKDAPGATRRCWGAQTKVRRIEPGQLD